MGIKKTIETPEQLWGLFVSYKRRVKKKTRKKFHLNIKTGLMVAEPLEVPLTKEGFYNYCADQSGIITLKDYFSNREDRYDEFVPICARILDEVRQDQIEGGMVGQYNPSITARLNGLTEYVDTTLKNPTGETFNVTLNINPT